MSDYIIPVEQFNGVDTVKHLVDLCNEIAKAVPDISFKTRTMDKWGFDTQKHTQGVCTSINIYHNTDINNHVGVIEVSNFYRESTKPKYGITSINIEDGRQTYGGEGAYKYSIHIKNIVRIAKKVIKPFTFDQIANRHQREFKNIIDNIGNTMRWELRQRTCDGYEHLMDDFEHLFYTGYTPKNAKFKQMMEYIMANKPKIDKYLNYDPDHYFVLVKDSEVQYRLNTAKGGTPNIVLSKDSLPDEIKGKLFVLDITDGKDFVEDVGLKENDGAYWIIA